MGRPSRNPALQQVNAQLPQPFLPESDVIEQKLDGVVLRLPPWVRLGYVQLIPSPWNQKRAFLAVTGTTDEGTKWATHVLANRYWALGGNLALIRGGEINTIDTRKLTRSRLGIAVSTAVPELTPVTATPAFALTPTVPGEVELTPTAQVYQTLGGTSRPGWLIPLITLTILALLAILVIAAWQARRRG
jgi:hypothetical protein